MITTRIAGWRCAAGTVATLCALTLAGVALATEQAQERREGRDVKQDAKQEARAAKVDCKAANQKSNPECRQDKRDAKQEGREDKREVKR